MSLVNFFVAPCQPEHEYIDPVGSVLRVEALTSGTVVVRIVDGDQKPGTEAHVIITPEALQEAADAAKRECAG